MPRLSHLSLFAAGLLGFGACSTDSGRADDDVGTIDLALAGRATSGAIYRLRDAELAISPTGQIFRTEDDPNRTVISARLDAGLYTLSLSAGWRLERISGGAAETVFAVLTSEDPLAFDVVPGGVTPVRLTFRADGQDVVTGQGDIDISIDVDDTSHLPPDAGPDAAHPGWPDGGQAPDGGVIDAGQAPDGGVIDAGVPDAGPIDAAPVPRPTIELTSVPPRPTRNATPYIRFLSSEPAERILCEVVGLVFAQPCTSPFTAPTVADGSYLFRFTATGADGATTVVEHTVDVDRTVLLEVQEPVVDRLIATFEFTTGEPSTYTCAIDGATPASCTSPFSTMPAFPGSHQIEIRARDTAGNVAIATRSFTTTF